MCACKDSIDVNIVRLGGATFGDNCTGFMVLVGEDIGVLEVAMVVRLGERDRA